MSTLAKPVSYGPSSAADPNEGRDFGGAFWVSTLLHVGLTALVLLFTLALREGREETPEPFVLVAGEGENFLAEAAPAGSEAGLAAEGEITFSAPEVPTWTPPAPAPEPEPTPVAPVPVAPIEPVKTPPTPPAPTPPMPNFARQINRTLQREKAKTERELKKKREADARAAKERELADKRMSHEEFLQSQKSRPGPKASGGSGAPGPRLDPGAIRKGVTGATGANSAGAGGKDLVAAQESAMKSYFAMLISRLRESHEKPGGLSDLLNAEVQFTVAANGAISGARIVRGSGNADFDQSVLDAFSRVRMPARPDGKTDVQRLTFRIKEA